MESRSVGQFIFIGTAVRYLQDLQPGVESHAQGGPLQNYHRLLEWLQENSLHVSYRAAVTHLNDVMYDISESGESEDDDPGGEVTAAQAAEVREGANKLRDTLLAETGGFDAFVVTDKRYPIATLLKEPAKMMAPGVYDSLPTIAQYDFKEAGRCVAFELPTAAAFHLMRGTEDVLKFFYCQVIKQRRATLMWGPMIKSLREKKRNPPSPVLLNNLDNLRVGFRNPTQHPEKIYDIHEVQDLMSLSIDVVNRMIRHLHPK